METDLHNLTPEELGRLFPIILSPPSHEWPACFEKERHYLKKRLKQTITGRIEHVGSTSVPSLVAKPCIDIFVEISGTPGTKSRIIEIMRSGGYEYMEEQTNHIMMVKGYTPGGMEIPSYHIHMGRSGHPYLEDMIRFRDLLRSAPQVAKAYEGLKKKLAARFQYDREAYTRAKAGFIQKHLGVQDNKSLNEKRE